MDEDRLRKIAAEWPESLGLRLADKIVTDAYGEFAMTGRAGRVGVYTVEQIFMPSLVEAMRRAAGAEKGLVG